MYWAELQGTDENGVKYCGECENRVYLVTGEAELEERARRGECVAIIAAAEIPSPHEAFRIEHGPIMVGRPALPPGDGSGRG